MGAEIAIISEDRINRIEEKLTLILEQQNSILNNNDRNLNSRDMCQIMAVSMRTFQKRIPILQQFGMRKEGSEWRMKRKDLDRAVDSGMFN